MISSLGLQTTTHASRILQREARLKIKETPKIVFAFKKKAMEEVRRQDPSYIDWQGAPKTAAEAVALFSRYRASGLNPEMWPEAFCYVSRELDDEQGALFEEWLVAPQGISKTAQMYQTDPQSEAVRLQLLAEAEARDAADLARKLEQQAKISPLEPEQAPMEECTELVFDDMDTEDDEKAPPCALKPSER